MLMLHDVPWLISVIRFGIKATAKTLWYALRGDEKKKQNARNDIKKVRDLLKYPRILCELEAMMIFYQRKGYYRDARRMDQRIIRGIEVSKYGYRVGRMSDWRSDWIMKRIAEKYGTEEDMGRDDG